MAKMMRSLVLMGAAASASALHLGGSAHSTVPTAKLQPSGQTALLARTAMPLKGAQLEHLKGGAPAEAKAGPLKPMLLIAGW